MIQVTKKVILSLSSFSFSFLFLTFPTFFSSLTNTFSHTHAHTIAILALLKSISVSTERASSVRIWSFAEGKDAEKMNSLFELYAYSDIFPQSQLRLEEKQQQNQNKKTKQNKTKTKQKKHNKNKNKTKITKTLLSFFHRVIRYERREELDRLLGVAKNPELVHTTSRKNALGTKQGNFIRYFSLFFLLFLFLFLFLLLLLLLLLLFLVSCFSSFAHLCFLGFLCQRFLKSNSLHNKDQNNFYI